MSLLQAVLLLALGASVPGLRAAEVEGLYEARVRVADQGVAERNRAVSEAFSQVVVKVTGHRGRSVEEAAAEASRFVQQFRYLADGGADPAAPTRLWLKVQFDKTAVDAWLRERGLTVWGAHRPGTLIWLGLERDRRRRLFVPELDPATSRFLERSAQERGLTVLLPLMDLEDTRSLSVSDLWGDFDESIRAASARYQPDAVLSGRVSEVAPKLWRGQWTLILGSRVERWRNQDSDLGGLLRAGINNAADKLAARFAPSGDAGETRALSLRVRGVRSLADYARVRSQLQSLDAVRNLRIDAVAPQSLRFSLDVRGDLKGLLNSLRIGGELVPVNVDPGESLGGKMLDYRLGP
jgi:hypothetical protein